MWNHDDAASSFVGLGYCDTSTPNLDPSGLQTTVDALMQQCLSYHKEQELLRHQQMEAVSASSHFVHSLRPDDDNVGTRTKKMEPVGVGVGQSGDPIGDRNTRCTNDVETTTTSNSGSKSTDENGALQLKLNDEDSRREIEEGRARATAIAARFAQQQQPPPQHPQATWVHALSALAPNNLAPNIDSIGDGGAIFVSPAMFAEQRRVSLAREAERNRMALLKNWDYLLLKIEKSSSSNNNSAAELYDLIEATAARDVAAQHRYSLQLQQRKARLMKYYYNTTTGENVATATLPDPRKRKRKRIAANPSSDEKARNTVAIYVAGLPTVESNNMEDTGDGCKDHDESADLESLVRQLFGGYGTIVKVHLYREKSHRQRIKGDCLIVYKYRADVNDHDNKALQSSSLVETVCMQVSV